MKRLCKIKFDIFIFSSLYFEFQNICEIYKFILGQVRIARIFNTYGPRMCIDDGRVVSNFVAQVTPFNYRLFVIIFDSMYQKMIWLVLKNN